MKNMSDVAHRRREYIGHILRKENNNFLTEMTWTAEAKERKKSEGEGEPSGRRNRLEDGEHGMRCRPQLSTEQYGDRLWRPYVLLGTKEHVTGAPLQNVFCDTLLR